MSCSALVAVRAGKYLHTHLEQGIGLDDLAETAGTDHFRLSRAFKAACGLAPYLMQQHLRPDRLPQALLKPFNRLRSRRTQSRHTGMLP